MGYVDKVANFSGGRLGGTVVDAGQVTGRVLQSTALIADGANGTMNLARIVTGAPFVQTAGI